MNDPRIPFRSMERALTEMEVELDVYARADAGFDGGEFSGPAWAEIIQERRLELLDKYGWDWDDFQEAAYRSAAINWEKTVAAQKEDRR